MSTNDLTARARARAAHWPMTETSALLSELADEVERLREERDGWQTLRNEWRQTARDLAAERDATRAALGLVRATIDRWDPDWLDTHRQQILNAIEGES